MKRKSITILLSLLAAIVLLLPACKPKDPFPFIEPGSYQFGTRMKIELTDASRDHRRISCYIWYPAILAADAEPSRYNFDAEPDFSGAPYPVILTSAKEGGYFGSHLASYGFVVIGVDGQEPKDNYGTWLVDYPLDQIAALRHVTANPPEGLEGLLDTNQVGAIGYSFGSNNALALAGARIDPDFYLSQCASAVPADPFPETWWIDYICNLTGGWENFVANAGSGISESENGLWQPITDPNIRAAIAMAPEGAWLFGEQGLASVDRPIMIIGATEDTINPYELEAAYIYAHLGSSEKSMVSFIGQDHFMIHNTESLNLLKHFAVAYFGYHLQENESYAMYIEEDLISKQEGFAWGEYKE